jgi:hypothetical protein
MVIVWSSEDHMVRVKVLVAAALVASAGVASGQAPAPASPATTTSAGQASKAKPVIVNGDLWLKSTNDLRKAFLVGAANMIALETAYGRKMGTPTSPAVERATHALQGMTLDQIASRVTKWYEANPTRHDVPVIGVIWIDMVKPDSTHR